MRFRRLYTHAKNVKKGALADQTIMFDTYQAMKDYPKKIRRIKFRDDETNQVFIFLTNNFKLKATDIALLYKYRWGIELFFKWIKQHLKVKSFWGT